ncbi:MAG: alpha/beta fold hydrolase, partial [Anaerolineales bacterium]|nr:alpha/beta fold hydrolase [Anaerolineales bacterium]
MPKAQSNGIELYYEVQGVGKPLVLISGLGYSLWQWHRMVPLLAEHFQVVTFDNRGVGQSDKPAGPYTAQMLAADTVGLLDALNIEKAVILGHSMGGFIAQSMALDFQQRVEKLILCSTNFGGPHHVPVTPEAMKVLADVTSDPLTRFKNGLSVSTAPGWAEKNPGMIEEWVKWRVANPIEPAH